MKNIRITEFHRVEKSREAKKRTENYTNVDPKQSKQIGLEAQQH